MTSPDLNSFNSIQSRHDYLSNAWRQCMLPFPTESDCFEELCRVGGISFNTCCSHCYQSGLSPVPGARFTVCTFCKRKNWRTAKTFFERIKKHRAWLGTILFMEQGLAFSAADLHRLAGVSNSTAGEIIKHVSLVILDILSSRISPEPELPDSDKSLNELSTTSAESSIHSGEFKTALVESADFLQVVGKRSRLTPANEHPRAEQTEMERLQFSSSSPPSPSSSSSSSSSSLDSDSSDSLGWPADILSNLSEDDRFLYSLLADESIHYEVLLSQFGKSIGEFSYALVNLQLAGLLVEEAGPRFKRATRKNSRRSSSIFESGSDDNESGKRQGIQQLVQSAINFIRSTFHAVSRKYLQSYLAIYSCVFNNKAWANGFLLSACQRAKPVRHSDLRNYVTPLLVTLASSA